MFNVLLNWNIGYHLTSKSTLFQEEHPCALASFHQMMNPAKGKQIVVFLDYDGTLSPIVNDPNRAFMTDQVNFSSSILILNSFHLYDLF